MTLWQPEEANGWVSTGVSRKEYQKEHTAAGFNFPHNPTGYLPPMEDYQRILEIVKEHDLYVFSDEMYRLLELNQSERLPSVCEIYDKAVTLFGMSKTFGMAGVRLGWLVTRNGELFQKLTEWKDYTTICGSAPSEILSIIGLRNKETIIARHLERIRRNLALLDEFMESHADLFSWTRPRAGTIAFPRLNIEEGADGFLHKVS